MALVGVIRRPVEPPLYLSCHIGIYVYTRGRQVYCIESVVCCQVQLPVCTRPYLYTFEGSLIVYREGPLK